jgi:hypothetical protein
MRFWRSRRAPEVPAEFELRIGGESFVIPRADAPRYAGVIASLQQLGGLLQCSACGKYQPLGDVGKYFAEGWPTHCGQAPMKWLTAEQVEAEWLKAAGPPPGKGPGTERLA